MAEYVIIGGLIAGGYLLAKKQGIIPPSPTSTTPPKGSVPTGPVPPHLIAGAILLTDQQIAQMEADTVAHWRSASGDKNRFIQHCISSVLPNERLLVSDISPGTHCQSGGSYAGPPLAIQAAKGGQLALGGASAFGLAGALGAQVIPIVGQILGAGLAIFGAISAHHAAAVRNEQALECQLAPPADYSLQVIDKAVLSGVMTIQQGQIALNTLYTDFVSSAKNGQSGQLNDSGGTCNAMCWYAHFLHAIILKKQNRYANLAA